MAAGEAVWALCSETAGAFFSAQVLILHHFQSGKGVAIVGFFFGEESIVGDGAKAAGADGGELFFLRA